MARGPAHLFSTIKPPNLRTSKPHRRDTRLRGASVVSHKFVYRGGRVSPPRFGRRACRLAFAIRGLSMRAIPTPRRGRQIAAEMPYHPNRLLRRCNLPGTPAFHHTRLLREMQSVGDPGRALAMLSSGYHGTRAESCRDGTPALHARSWYAYWPTHVVAHARPGSRRRPRHRPRASNALLRRVPARPYSQTIVKLRRRYTRGGPLPSRSFEKRCATTT
jgi:hypothetical protein